MYIICACVCHPIITLYVICISISYSITIIMRLHTQVARLVELDGMGVEALCTVRPCADGEKKKPTPYKVSR